MKVCHVCGVPDTPETNRALWDVYHRLDNGGRKYIAPFVYTQDELEEAGFYDDEETHDSYMYAMEKNMIERGLCGECGRPDLRGVTEDQILSEEDAQDMADMYAEMEAERRAGC